MEPFFSSSAWRNPLCRFSKRIAGCLFLCRVPGYSSCGFSLFSFLSCLSPIAPSLKHPDDSFCRFASSRPPTSARIGPDDSTLQSLFCGSSLQETSLAFSPPHLTSRLTSQTSASFRFFLSWWTERFSLKVPFSWLEEESTFSSLFWRRCLLRH